MKRRRVERAVLIWPKESKKLEHEDEEIQHGSKIKNFISSLPNFAAGLVIITTLSAILSNVIINLYYRGYSQYFGISDYLNNDRIAFLFLLVALVFLFVICIILGNILAYTFHDWGNMLLGISGTFIGCFLFTYGMFIIKNINTDTVFMFALLETTVIFTCAFYQRNSSEDKFLEFIEKVVDTKFKKKLSLFTIFLIWTPVLLISCITIISSMRTCINMFSEMGFSYAQVESNYKIVSYENETEASYLLLENTDHQYILMEVKEVSCEDTKICYKGTRGKYQYIDDLTDLQIQETHCKIMFDE